MQVLEGDITPELMKVIYGAGVISVDIETSGLSRRDDKIACIQFHIPQTNQSYLIRNVQRGMFTNIIASDRVVKLFHYALFDLAFIVRDFHIYPEAIWCTKVLAKILDPQRQMFFDPNKGKHGHSLAALVNTLQGVKLEKNTALSNWFAPEYSKEQLEYAENDVKYLKLIADEMVSMLSYQKKIVFFDICKSIGAVVTAYIEYGIEDAFSY